MHTLNFKKNHLSINDFESVSIPDFTVITGVNGSGKTHLLRSIECKAIASDAIRATKRGDRQIAYFNWQNLSPSNDGSTTEDGVKEEEKRLEYRFNSSVNVQNAKSAAANFLTKALGKPMQNINLSQLLEYSAATSKKTEGQTQLSEEISDKLKLILMDYDRPILEEVLQADPQVTRYSSQSLQKPIAAMTCAEFTSIFHNRWGRAKIFDQSLSLLFTNYRNALVRNKLIQLQCRETGKSSQTYFTDEDFSLRYGPPPWDMVNETLARINLDFEVTCPDEHSYSEFRITLRKKSTHTPVKFSDLSSGEKILTSLALCSYYANDDRQILETPSILLLDEVDASLHPQMARKFIEIARDVICKQLKCKVIITTHSPSTISFCEEDSIYAIQNSTGSHKLIKTSKNEAITSLCHGVPTLAISYHGRRQVFVESPTDMEAYSQIYQSIRDTITSERSLAFISPGIRGKDGDQNTGRAVVKKVVSELRQSGAESVFGLIDWDGENTSNGSIHVMAENKADTLENILLDPLMISMLLTRSKNNYFHLETGATDASYSKLTGRDPAAVRLATDHLTTKLFGNIETLVEVSYIDGFRIEIDERFQKTDGHKLAEKYLDEIPELKGVCRNSNELVRKALQILAEHPGFTPAVIKAAFEKLLT